MHPATQPTPFHHSSGPGFVSHATPECPVGYRIFGLQILIRGSADNYYSQYNGSPVQQAISECGMLIGQAFANESIGNGPDAWAWKITGEAATQKQRGCMEREMRLALNYGEGRYCTLDEQLPPDTKPPHRVDPKYAMGHIDHATEPCPVGYVINGNEITIRGGTAAISVFDMGKKATILRLNMEFCSGWKDESYVDQRMGTSSDSWTWQLTVWTNSDKGKECVEEIVRSFAGMDHYENARCQIDEDPTHPTPHSTRQTSA